MSGPGDRFKRLAGAAGFRPCAKCERLAMLMDHNESLAPGWCSEHFEELKTRIVENAGGLMAAWIPSALTAAIRGGLQFDVALTAARLMGMNKRAAERVRSCCGGKEDG